MASNGVTRVQKHLPEQFREFDKYADKWCLGTERERYATRVSAPYSELKEIYDAMLPRLSEVIDHLNRFPLNALPERERNLMHLTFSLMEMSHAVELWRQSDVPEAMEARRLEIVLQGDIVPEGAIA